MTEPIESPAAPADQARIDRIRKSRNKVLGLLLAAFVILVFAISIVKIAAR